MADVRARHEAEIKRIESNLSLNAAKQNQLAHLVSLFQSLGSGYDYYPKN